MSSIELIVGLGNPGKDYADTRHNAGVWWINFITAKYNLNFKLEPKLFGRIASCNIDNHKIKVFIPNTFMNESGKAVAAIANFYKTPAEKILVAHDDLDLSPGTIRIKHGGGHGGHNGLRNIIPALSNKNFTRFRIGIGHPGDKDKVASFVLKPANKNDKEQIDHSLSLSIDYIADIVSGKLEKAMNFLHTLPIKK